MRLIKAARVLDTNLAFRHPLPDTSSFEEKEKIIMPDLPGLHRRIRDWQVMRRYIPQIEKSFILLFIQRVNPLAGEGSRVWYRALQRMMDMGSLSGLWGVPAKDGIMWIGTRYDVAVVHPPPLQHVTSLILELCISAGVCRF